MPAHDIEMQVPAQMIKNADATITIRADGEILGRLKVSRGSVDWIPGRAVRYGYRMRWEAFDALMRADGKQFEVRSAEG